MGKPKTIDISSGNSDNITVARNSRPEEMYEVLLGQDTSGNPFRIVKNMEFLKWRFANERYSYLFYTLKSNGISSGYLVMRISKSHRRGFIIDYEENCSGAIESILKFIINKRHFDLISVYTYGIRDYLIHTLNALGFRLNTPLRIAEKKVKGEIPLLVRPSNPATDEKDFLLFGQDIRKQESWRLEEVCSDGT
ncbi:hypothetical protein ACFLT2_06260 [Acidobacteriota bacterium]